LHRPYIVTLHSAKELPQNILCFCTLYCSTPFQDPKETVDITAPASQVCLSALLLLILAGY